MCACKHVCECAYTYVFVCTRVNNMCLCAPCMCTCMCRHACVSVLCFWTCGSGSLSVLTCVYVWVHIYSCVSRSACTRVCVPKPSSLPHCPASVYPQRCKYDTCNCQNNEECLCAALSSYARACAAKGVTLRGWRENVCSECRPLPASWARGPGFSMGRGAGARPSIQPLSPVAAHPESRERDRSTASG